MKYIKVLIYLTLIFSFLPVSAQVGAELSDGNQVHWQAASTHSGKRVDLAPVAAGSQESVLFIPWMALGAVLLGAALFIPISEVLFRGRENIHLTTEKELGIEDDEAGTVETFERRRISS